MEQKYKVGLAPHIINKLERDSPVNRGIGWLAEEVTKDELIAQISAGVATSAHFAGGHRNKITFSARILSRRTSTARRRSMR